MASTPAENIKTCGVCSGSLSITGQRQATFTSECSHSFHIHCISNNLSHGSNNICPVCHAKWNNLPFTTPIPNPNFNHTNLYNNNPFFKNPNSQFSLDPFIQFPQPLFPPNRFSDSEPFQFTDDEPLPDYPTSTTPPAGLQKVEIRAVPEHPAIAASESVSRFTVLVGLKAPSLSNNGRFSQRAPIDLVTVLDVSGSMQGAKLALLKQAVHFVIDNLGPNDRLSIVSFSDQARRLLPLLRMIENGRREAKRAVDSIYASGGTNIVEGLKKGVRVLGERQHKNPVASIMFLSDGNDTYNGRSSVRSQFSSNSRQAPPGYLHLLPASIFPENRWPRDGGEMETIPVHSFGFGSDHDPVTMHAISDASGGTFSFIESYEMVQDAFAGCIGGLLSVVAQELRLMLRSASHGVEIKSISSGRYASAISNQSSQGQVTVGDLYADEEKEFLIDISVPILVEDEGKTSLLDIMCSYKDVVIKETVQTEIDLVEIRRPKSLSPSDKTVNLEVDRQRNRLFAAESIAKAQEMAERGNLVGARTLLAKTRTDLSASSSGQAGDGLCMWLEADMKEIERRMGSMQLYQQEGRAYALSGMSSHALQRATMQGGNVAGAPQSFGGGGATAACAPQSFGGYATPNMVFMVQQSQQLNKKDGVIPKKE